MSDLSFGGAGAPAATTAEWPRDSLEAVPRCPACGSASRRTLYRDLTDRVFFCAPGRWTLHECAECRSAYLDPRPSLASIHLAYRSYYTHRRRQRQHDSELDGLRRFARALANGYRNHRYGSDFRPSSALGPVAVPLLLPLRRAFDGEMRYLPPLRPGARLLDVGFGDALFLDVARRVGWQVAGADPDPKVIEHARHKGFEVRQGGVEAYADAIGRFDVVTLGHVIEHVHQPRATLQAAFELLRPGGCLYLDTPNVESAGHRRYREHWRGLEVPRHLVLFSAAALHGMLRDAGFARIDRHCHSEILAGLAPMSHAIAEGRDPYAPRPPSWRLLARAALSELATLFDEGRSEFITLSAYKAVEGAGR